MQEAYLQLESGEILICSSCREKIKDQVVKIMISGDNNVCNIYCERCEELNKEMERECKLFI